ncbi:hypothetical protein ACF0H5_011041 [Mactra antiquata]
MDIDDLITTVSPGNGTTPTCDHGNGTPLYWGYVAAAIAVICYGTTFIPVKKFDTGDGMFFQWIFGLSTGLYGLIIQQIRGNPKFYLLPMLGGVSFITGNLTLVPIIKMIGLGLGFSIWGITNLLSGWATGRFGLFGLKSDPPDNLLLNDLGVILAVFSTVIFAFVKNEVSTSGIDKTETVTFDDSDEQQLLPKKKNNNPGIAQTKLDGVDAEQIIIQKHSQQVQRGSVNSIDSDFEDGDLTDDKSFIDNLSPNVKRISGLLLSLVAGVFYGQVFTPYIYVQNNYDGSSQNGLDYVFSTLCGSMVTSTVYFLLYATYKKNRPRIYPRAIIPAFISGLLWTIATSCWFVSNLVLSESVAFPIITTGPTVVANLLGVFIFKEVKGSRNLLILTCGILITVTGAILTGFSKKSTKC